MKQKTQRIILGLVFSFLVMLGINLPANAQQYKGSCGDNLKWTYDTETMVLSINGSGEMMDYGSLYAATLPPWSDYKGSVVKIELSDEITYIGSYAFSGCSKITEIELPDRLEKIGKGAFSSCAKLESIVIPDRVLEIPDSCFEWCTSLKDVQMSDNVWKIDRAAFFQCKALTDFDFPENLKVLGGSAFQCCDGLVTVDLPLKLQEVGAQAFQACENLRELDFPVSVQKLGTNVAKYCDRLERIIIRNPNCKIETSWLSSEYWGAVGTVTVYCYDGSQAYEYAVNGGYNFEFLGKYVGNVFTDIKSDWYIGYVQYVYENRLMSGIKGTTLFQPNTNITKAQVAQVLYNMDGQPKVKDKNVFKELKDVYATEWYADAVAWAYNTGVVTGDKTTLKFHPNAAVTREQLALMMYRYAIYKGYDTSKTTDLAGLKNAYKVSSWSLAGVKWAVGSELISGIEKNGAYDLAPQGNATRAQMATILQRFCEKR